MSKGLKIFLSIIFWPIAAPYWTVMIWVRKKFSIGPRIALTILGIFLSLPIIQMANALSKGSPTSSNKQPSAVVQNAPEPTTVRIEQVGTESFIAEFDANQLAAEQKYKGKTIQFTGKIENISEDIFNKPFLSIAPLTSKKYYGTTIKCTFNDKNDLMSVKNGQTVSIAGVVAEQSLGIIGVRDCKLY